MATKKKKTAKKPAAKKSPPKKKVAKKAAPKKASAKKSKKTVATQAKTAKKTTKKTVKKAPPKKVVAPKVPVKTSVTKNAVEKKKAPVGSSSELSLRNLAAMRLAGIVRQHQPIDFASAWQQAMPLAKERGITGLFMAAFTMNDNGINWYAASVAVGNDTAIEGPMQEVQVSGGRYIVFTYVGGYEGIGAAWGAFMDRVKAEGQMPDSHRPYLEIYKDDGSASKDKVPSTDLCIPV